MRTLEKAVSTAYLAAIRNGLAAIMAVLLGIMILQVLFRYGLNSSLIWAEEICRYLLIWASFLACGIAYQRGEIAAIEIADRRLPPRGAAALGVVRNIAVLVLLAVLIVYGWRYAELSGTQPIPGLGFLLSDLFGSGITSPVTVFWIYVSVPVGMALLGIHVALQALRQARVLLAGPGPKSRGPEPPQEGQP